MWPMEVQPLGSDFGAVVTVGPLAQLPAATFRDVLDVAHRYAVVVFPGQHLADDDHLAFARRFGPLERALNSRSDTRFSRLSSVRGNGDMVQAGSSVARMLESNMAWHTDSSFKPIPAAFSLLSCKEAAATGGETEFADLRAAWDALDPVRRGRVEGRSALHSYLWSQEQAGAADWLSEEDWAALPPVNQPLVRTHPATGRRNLYLGRHARQIIGEDAEASGRFLAELCEWACQAPRVFAHRWSTGDLVVWDNRCVAHRGRPFPYRERRIMVRATVAGDPPPGERNPWALD
jgi:alpha-ketoglutarate-dependent 2,4-dichlorophenoxyacetate dioxygenase